MLYVTIGCYLVGALFALIVTRNGAPKWWRHFIRGQFLVAGLTLSVAAGWKFQPGGQLAEAIGIALVWYAIKVVSVLTRRSGGVQRSVGEAILEAWAACPNTGYWMIPMTTMIVGPSGTVVAVLADQLIIPMFVWSVRRMRNDAPHPQKAHTSIFDFAGPTGFATGILLGFFLEPPHWVNGVLVIVAAFLAFVGAAMWAGSMRTVLGQLDRPTRHSWQRFLGLSAIRIVGSFAVAAVFWGTPAAPIAFLAAFTFPTSLPPSYSLLYGYRSDVVGIASRWGWLLAPFGLLLAWWASTALA